MEPTKNYSLNVNFNVNEYKIKRRVVFSQDLEYIFDVKKIGDTKLAVSGSNLKINIYDQNSLNLISTLDHHKKPISSIKRINQKQDIFLSSSEDKTIALWDLRASLSPIQIWTDNQNSINSIDINCDESLLIAGTSFSTYSREAKILFWDLRTNNIVQEFIECHNDDITLIEHHPTDKNRFLSGGMDGLICSYNLISQEEDDNLEKTINFGNSIMSCGYFGQTQQFIFALSHMETFAIFSSEGDLIHDFGSIKNSFCRKSDFIVDYVIGCHYDKLEDQLYLMAGSYNGKIGIFLVKGEGELQLYQVLKDGHSDVVRSVYWDNQSKEIITGAEDGKLISWIHQIQNKPNVESRPGNIKNTNHIRFSPY
ncbi:WD40 repeat-like protein [Neoconidiobolus thromboides FSU 785]|nr:WD40 repeat-like protein [Neoconidiobolus thromboides FSU 785]